MADNLLSSPEDVFPDQGIDPREKGYEYILKTNKAAWSNGKAYTPQTMGWYGRTRINEIHEYCLGKQSNSKYKKLLNGDEQTDKSWTNTDWTPPAFMPKYVDIAVSKVLQRNFEVEAFCVDPLAKSEEDTFFNQMKVKIMMREAAQQSGSDLANSPTLQAVPGEAADGEQLQIQMKYGYKHQKAMESELGISLIQQQNNIEELRKRVVESLVKIGLGGYKVWIDYNGMVRIREVTPGNLITSYCVKKDFSDATYVGEVIYVSVADLAPYFKPDQLDYICKNIAGQYGNPNSWPMVNMTNSRAWNKFKVAVLDLSFQNYNTTVYKKEFDGRGNFRMQKSGYENVGKKDIIDFQGEAEPKYLDVTREVWYKSKWIIGTDFMYDYGLMENQPRKQSTWWATQSGYHLYAWNFNDMIYSGLAERLIPLEDQACLVWYRMQNLACKLIPYIVNLDLNSFEGINMGKGGESWKPSEAVDFLFQNFVAVYRSTDLLSRNPNYKPVTIEATGQLAIFGEYREELLSLIDMMRQVTGLNEATDASTINSKNLNSTNASMIQSTNNALQLIMEADKYLMNCVADDIVQRIQIAVKLGKVEGYVKALGSDSVKFLQINPDISNYELGIFIKDAPTYEERQAFYQELNLKDSQGLISPADKIIVMSCTNLKQGAELLAYNIDKRQQEAHARQMQLMQMQTQGNMQTAQALEEAKQETVSLQGQIDMEKIAAQAQADYWIESMKKSSEIDEAHIQGMSKIIAQQILANAQVTSTHISTKNRPKKTA